MENACTNGLTTEDIAALRRVCDAALDDDINQFGYLGTVEVLAEARYDKAERDLPLQGFRALLREVAHTMYHNLQEKRNGRSPTSLQNPSASSPETMDTLS